MEMAHKRGLTWGFVVSCGRGLSVANTLVIAVMLPRYYTWLVLPKKQMFSLQ